MAAAPIVLVPGFWLGMLAVLVRARGEDAPGDTDPSGTDAVGTAVPALPVLKER